MSAEAVAEEDSVNLSERISRTETARQRSRAVELQAVAIMWLGVVLAVAGIGVLIAIGEKFSAGALTFGGAGVVLLGLLRGAYGHYLYWRLATG